MKSPIVALTLAATVIVGQAAPSPRPAPASAPAQVTAPAPQASAPGTPQRQKMKLCNADAKAHALHGDDRRAFMKQCLSGKARSPAR